MYQFDATPTATKIKEMVRYSDWRIENLLLVSCVTKGEGTIDLSQPETDKTQGKPMPGYPWHLPTSQTIDYVKYHSGRQTITFSACKHHPYSSAQLLTLFEMYRREIPDFNKWTVSRIETNTDLPGLRIEGIQALTVEILESVFLKEYNHGNSLRIEVADYRKTPLREITGFIQEQFNRTTAQTIIQSFTKIDKRLSHVEKLLKGRIPCRK